MSFLYKVLLTSWEYLCPASNLIDLKQYSATALGLLIFFAAQAQKETSMVTLKSLTPNIMVEDVNQTLNYYRDILGFEIVDTNPGEGRFEWGFVMKGEAGLMFQEVSSLTGEYPSLAASPLGGAMTFYILVQENIEGWFASLNGKVKVIKELNTTFYGTKEFAIEDINGFILTFSERKE